MIVLYIFLCLCLLIFVLAYTKDLACPASVVGIVWLFVYCMLFICYPKLNYSNVYFASFFCASVCFVFGFLLSYPVSKKIDYNSFTTKIEIKPTAGKIILFIGNCCALLYFLKFIPFFNSGRLFFSSIRNAVRSGEVSSKIPLEVLEMTFFVMFAVYLNNPSMKNKRYFVLSLPCLIVLLLTSATRGEWAFLIITVLFLIIYMKNVSNRHILIFGLGGIILFLLLFYFSTISILQDRGSFYKEEVLSQFVDYFASPAVAFIHWANSSPIHYYGQYTFRFFIAVLSKIIPFVHPKALKMDFSDAVDVNVYTSLHWCALDFGVIWSLFINILLGILFGLFYKKIKTLKSENLFFKIGLSMLTVGLVYMFFTDMLISITSIWLRRFIILYFFTLPKYVIEEKNISEK